MKERKLVKTQSWSLFRNRFNHLNGNIQHLPPDVSDCQGGKAPGLKLWLLMGLNITTNIQTTELLKSSQTTLE